jgi:hypothetical protein
MSDTRTFILAHDLARRRAVAAVAEAPAGHVILIRPPRRSGEQTAKFHAICSDLARARVAWAGKPRDAAAWKVLLVSGHAVATKDGAEIVPGLEGEFVNIRESTAAMSKARGSSLIEYAVAFCSAHGVECETA